MNAKALFSSIAAGVLLLAATAGQAAVVVKQVNAAVSTPVSTQFLPSASEDLGARVCRDRPGPVSKYLCLCRKGVDLPRCPPSRS